MCLLLLQHSADKILPKDIFDKIWDANSDGFGLGFLSRKNQFHAYKTLNKQEAWDKYIEVFQSKAWFSWLIVHWRIKTHGTICEENCHPFMASNNIMIAHNGIMINLPTKNGPKEPEPYPPSWSDTRYFASILAQNMPLKTQPLSQTENSNFIYHHLGTSRLITIESHPKELKKAKAIYWNFPDQRTQFAEYGCFSNYAFATTRVKYAYTGSYGQPYYGHTPNHEDKQGGRFPNLGTSRDVVMELPSVWWIVNEILNDPSQPWMNVQHDFQEKFKRQPTACETEAAYTATLEILEADTTKNDDPKTNDSTTHQELTEGCEC